MDTYEYEGETVKLINPVAVATFVFGVVHQLEVSGF